MHTRRKRTRQADRRTAGCLNRPEHAEQANDRQANKRQRVEQESGLDIAVQQRYTHPGAAAERAIPTRDRAEGTREPKARRRVERAEGESAGEKGADISGCAGRTKWPDVS